MNTAITDGPTSLSSGTLVTDSLSSLSEGPRTVRTVNPLQPIQPHPLPLCLTRVSSTAAQLCVFRETAGILLDIYLISVPEFHHLSVMSTR